MHGPPLVNWLLVVLCGTVGLYCLVRTRSAPTGERGAAASEAIMGFGMAVMAVPAPAFDFRPLALTLVFAAVGARSLVLVARSGRRADHAHHAVGAAAMMYMAVSGVSGHGAHGSTGPSGLPPLTGALLLYFALRALWAGTGLIPATVASEPGGRGQVSSEAKPHDTCTGEQKAACQVSMAIGMFAMLLSL